MKKLKIALAAVLLTQGAAAMAAYHVRIPVKGLTPAVAVTPQAPAPAPAPTNLSCTSAIGEIAHGTTQTAYSSSFGSSLASCASASTQFSCNNGVLTSSNLTLSPEAYWNTSCSVLAPPPQVAMQVEVWNIHGYDPVLMTALSPSVSLTGYTTVYSGDATFEMAEGTCYRCQFTLYQDGLPVAQSTTTTAFEQLYWNTTLPSDVTYQLHVTSNGSDWPGPFIQVRKAR